MRRKNDKQIKKVIKFLVLGIIGVLCGLFMLAYPFMPTKPYDEYNEKVIIISSLKYGGTVGAHYHYIVTEDGEKYTITGEYNGVELHEILLNGTKAIIKYDTNNIFPFLRYAEEVTVDENKIVTYDDDIPVNPTPFIVLGVLFFLVGVGFLVVYRWDIICYRKIQAKRDARIIKKYGKLKK